MKQITRLLRTIGEFILFLFSACIITIFLFIWLILIWLAGGNRKIGYEADGTYVGTGKDTRPHKPPATMQEAPTGPPSGIPAHFADAPQRYTLKSKLYT